MRTILAYQGGRKEETEMKEGNRKEHKKKFVSEEQDRKTPRQEGSEDSMYQNTKEIDCKQGPL